MKAEIICFSGNGMQTALEIYESLRTDWEITLWIKSKYAKAADGFLCVTESLPSWTAAHWQSEMIVFVGAVGIAVRAIAGSVASKTTDPAIVVLDERKNFCIPLLSGHLGGANEYALRIAGITGSTPVVTTATDVNRLFAVDVFAAKNHLKIDSMLYAKEVSAALLAGHRIGVFSELEITGEIPKGLTLLRDRQEADSYELGIYIGIHREEKLFRKTLQLIPDILCLGMGCKRDTEIGKAEVLFEEVTDQYGIDPRAFCLLSSIDIKKEEKALISLADRLKIPFMTYTSGELMSAQGEFTPSAFVKSITGVDNVCERSAYLSSLGGELIVKKTAKDGVTAAIAVKNRRICFE